MLAQVTRAEKSGDAIVFLAWAPHPMNTAHDLTYLSGGDAYFGPDYGGATVWTLAAHRLGRRPARTRRSSSRTSSSTSTWRTR